MPGEVCTAALVSPIWSLYLVVLCGVFFINFYHCSSCAPACEFLCGAIAFVSLHVKQTMRWSVLSAHESMHSESPACDWQISAMERATIVAPFEHHRGRNTMLSTATLLPLLGEGERTGIAMGTFADNNISCSNTTHTKGGKEG